MLILVKCDDTWTHADCWDPVAAVECEAVVGMRWFHRDCRGVFDDAANASCAHGLTHLHTATNSTNSTTLCSRNASLIPLSLVHAYWNDSLAHPKDYPAKEYFE